MTLLVFDETIDFGFDEVFIRDILLEDVNEVASFISDVLDGFGVDDTLFVYVEFIKYDGTSFGLEESTDTTNGVIIFVLEELVSFKLQEFNHIITTIKEAKNMIALGFFIFDLLVMWMWVDLKFTSYVYIY